MSIARGEYIAILDSDDLAMPDRLAVQFEYLETHPEVTLVGSQGARIDENDRIIGDINVPTDPSVIKYRLITENVFIQSGIFFRKKEILSIGGYDEKFQHVEDFDLYSRLLKRVLSFSTCRIGWFPTDSATVPYYPPLLHTKWRSKMSIL